MCTPQICRTPGACQFGTVDCETFTSAAPGRPAWLSTAWVAKAPLACVITKKESREDSEYFQISLGMHYTIIYNYICNIIYIYYI